MGRDVPERSGTSVKDDRWNPLWAGLARGKTLCGGKNEETTYYRPIGRAYNNAVWAEEVDEIVVSATGIPTPISQIGASVDVISAEDLERKQITYLQDALKQRLMCRT